MKVATRIVGESTFLSGGHPVGHVRRRRLTCTDLEVAASDGIRLAVRDYGSASARHTVVLLHGLCVSDEVWSSQVNYLLRRYGNGIRVITYDHRGHGRSDIASPDTYSIGRLAGDLADVLTALDVDGRLTVVGHSMGGMTALAYLGRRRADRPVEPDALVLVATAAGKLTERGLGRLLATPAAAPMLALVDRIPKAALDAVTGSVCSTLSKIWPAQRAMLTTVANRVSGTAVPTMAGFLPSLRTYDQYSTLGAIRARTIVLSGGADPVTPAPHSHDLAGAIPDATHVHLPRAGHMLPGEVPELVNESISRAMLPDDAAGRPAELVTRGA